ncbi:hypothetical protein K2W90_05765 [Candidatus Babeliales bacterium]|nr:hypothetical protein [Candidatus Babeliales bacterium]
MRSWHKMVCSSMLMLSFYNFCFSAASSNKESRGRSGSDASDRPKTVLQRFASRLSLSSSPSRKKESAIIAEEIEGIIREEAGFQQEVLGYSHEELLAERRKIAEEFQEEHTPVKLEHFYRLYQNFKNIIKTDHFRGFAPEAKIAICNNMLDLLDAMHQKYAIERKAKEPMNVDIIDNEQEESLCQAVQGYLEEEGCVDIARCFKAMRNRSYVRLEHVV